MQQRMLSACLPLALHLAALSPNKTLRERRGKKMQNSDHTDGPYDLVKMDALSCCIYVCRYENL